MFKIIQYYVRWLFVGNFALHRFTKSEDCQVVNYLQSINFIIEIIILFYHELHMSPTKYQVFSLNLTG